jgi:hypothetical protein
MPVDLRKPGYNGMVSKSFRHHATNGRKFDEGILNEDLDPARFTEWALLNRGYVVLAVQDQWQREGYYTWKRKGLRDTSGHDSDTDLDEDGFNLITNVPIGAEKPPSWAEFSWKNHHPGLWAWFTDEEEMRPYYMGASLWRKADVYIDTSEPTYTPRKTSRRSK